MIFEHTLEPDVPEGTGPDRSWWLGVRLAVVKASIVMQLFLFRVRPEVTAAEVVSWPIARWIGKEWLAPVTPHRPRARRRRPRRRAAKARRRAA